MKTYLCAVTNRYPENYQIGLHAQRWGVEEKYEKRIQPVDEGDTLVFMVGGEFRSIHRIESEPFRESTLLWPPKDGSIFPHRIKISLPLYRGAASVGPLVPDISFMRGKDIWQGTVQGRNGIFNDRLTEADVRLIEANLAPVGTPAFFRPPEMAAAPEPISGAVSRVAEGVPYSVEDAELSLGRVLQSLRLQVLSELTQMLPRRDIVTAALVCMDQRGVHVVVHLHAQQPPPGALLRLLYDMSWVRQSVKNLRDIRGILFAEAFDRRLTDAVGEIPNVEMREHRVRLDSLGGGVA